MIDVGTPREVGYLPLTLMARKQLSLMITERQRDIIVGSILGDAYIYPLGKIQFEQSDKQYDYILWKFTELENLAYSQPSQICRHHSRAGIDYVSYRFWLRQYFRPWRTIFYQDNKKVIPQSLRLTPLMVAVWYMDDGSFSDKTCVISTDSFSFDSVHLIQLLFKQQYGIETLIRSNGKLLIRAQSTELFSFLIKNHIHESMLYKLP